MLIFLSGSARALCQHPGHGHEAAASDEELEDDFSWEGISAGEHRLIWLLNCFKYSDKDRYM